MASKNFEVKNGITIGNTIVSNTTVITVGNSSQNSWLTANGLYVNGSLSYSSGGFYRGSYGPVGNINNQNNIFRINANTINANVQIMTGENTSAVGPIVVSGDYALIIDTGARVVIV